MRRNHIALFVKTEAVFLTGHLAQVGRNGLAVQRAKRPLLPHCLCGSGTLQGMPGGFTHYRKPRAAARVTGQHHKTFHTRDGHGGFFIQAAQ